MNPKSVYLVGAVSTLGLALSLQAADQTPTPSERTKNDYHARQLGGHDMDGREVLGTIEKANDIIGLTIQNQQDKKLGSVKDLGVDLKTGRIVYVVVSTGGLLGVGSESVLMPPQMLQCNRERKVIHLDTTKERLQAAPKFESSNWDDYSQSNRVAEIYAYYNLRPYFQESDMPKHAMRHATMPGKITSAEKIMGMDVRNHQDEKLGTVDNLLINLEKARISQVVISPGGFLGIADELSVMPPASFSYSSDGKHLVMDTTKESLTAAPHFKDKEWPNFSDPEYAGSVYQSYRVEPYFKTSVDANSTGRNTEDRGGGQLTPSDQGTSSTDVEITRNIRKELVAQKTLSVNAQNVKVITKNGEITLRGPVDSQEEKLQIVEIATRYAVNARVNNQLEVMGQNN